MADPISDIHLAIEPLLRPWFPVARWQIDAVPAPLSLGEFQRLLRTTAWIGVAWREFRIDQAAGRRLKGVHELMLTIAVKNAGGIGPRLFGDRLGPGLYPALATAAGALHGRTLEGFGSLHVTRAAQAYADGYGDLTVAIGAVELQCMTMLAPDLGEPAAAPPFTKLVSDWEAAPAIEGAPTATDTLQLPGAPAP
ncbi:hypothetical protein [Xanthobacter sp. KR7-225]|uniref:hypothetical protein n=1 Tax=Xanthobacter sp. KR7-225 TaxID=3156613 RepID=UPI0032B476C1